VAACRIGKVIVEREYGFWHTGIGCLAGVVLLTAALIATILIVIHLPVPLWVRVLIAIAIICPTFWATFKIDERARKLPDQRDSEK